MKKTIRIKSKFRFITFVTVLVLAMSMLMGVAFPVTASSPADANYREIRVQTGDTLWKIAKAYGDQSMDVREVVYEICRINSVEAGSIYPGQTLRIPY